mmetsp:Transcript_8152/g.20901  ORF Transcript_8152/g.20901 Transcript_8152/m.20901 type:complete len:328 (-) Transcript_8152:1295-2278(-)
MGRQEDQPVARFVCDQKVNPPPSQPRLQVAGPRAPQAAAPRVFQDHERRYQDPEGLPRPRHALALGEPPQGHLNDPGAVARHQGTVPVRHPQQGRGLLCGEGGGEQDQLGRPDVPRALFFHLRQEAGHHHPVEAHPTHHRAQGLLRLPADPGPAARDHAQSDAEAEQDQDRPLAAPRQAVLPGRHRLPRQGYPYRGRHGGRCGGQGCQGLRRGRVGRVDPHHRHHGGRRPPLEPAVDQGPPPRRRGLGHVPPVQPPRRGRREAPRGWDRQGLRPARRACKPRDGRWDHGGTPEGDQAAAAQAPARPPAPAQRPVEPWHAEDDRPEGP